MPESGRRRPQAASCEEYDEENQTTRPGTQTTANVSAKRSDQDIVLQQREKTEFYMDGGDSGYASRAATTVSSATTSSRRKNLDLKLDTTGIPERERHPYLYSQSAEPKSSSRRQSSSQSKEPSPEKRSTKIRDDLPERGYPDPYAKQSEPKQSTRAAHPPPSPVAARMVMHKGAKDDQALPPKTRRLSSSQQPRPVSMAPPNGPYSVQYAVYPTYPPVPVSTSGYVTPVTPSVPYASMPYSYPAPPAPPTPSYASYVPPPSYFDQLPEPRSAKQSRHASPVRRGNGYGDPVIRQGYTDSGTPVLERVSSKDSRPTLPTHKSARSVEVDRANMPPPARPHQPEAIPVRRPSTRRSQTYHPNEPTVREKMVWEPGQYDSDDDREYRQVRSVHPTAVRERRESSNRLPPTSFRPLPTEPKERPQARKSVSYSAGTTVTKVATSASNVMPRRKTVPYEENLAESEKYQAKRNSAAATVAASGLTHEALRKLEQRTSSSKSETGSNFSHKSSSKDSSGRDRSQSTAATKTSINLPGGMNLTIPEGYLSSRDSRPLSINIGGLVVSVAPEGKENEQPKEQKRIERAPSIASRTSKWSAASSVISNPRGREMPAVASRRPSQLEDRAPISVRSSRQPSRAPSTTRRSHDYASRRQSVDYSRDAEYDRDRAYDDYNAAY
ncbi:hypothetical protein H2200_012315 [Cladophialophora chaetospira]|uniref:Uncharacterized protein n=1 Tax=Cladophialophora chaetospira TaxID=386627 RepID=A0AA39CCC5_9EURO|nr:hypothetical protein H2200_012315 [Cladophialophora chaetospira]